MPVLVEVYPNRLGRKFAEDRRESKYTPQQRLDLMIKRGLSAQLRTANFLTGQAYVAFDFYPHAVSVTNAGVNDQASSSFLQLPTIPSTTDQLQTQVSDIALKLSKVPFDQIGQDLQESLRELKQTLESTGNLAEKLNDNIAPEMMAAMKDVRKTVNAVEHTLSADAPLQQDLRETLQELARAAASMRILTDYFERHPESIIRGKRGDDK
jgi:paraquat-inducible protein B